MVLTTKDGFVSMEGLANGFPLAVGEALPIELGKDVLLYGIVAADTEEVRIMEGA